jgi:hypothetical protein
MQAAERCLAAAELDGERRALHSLHVVVVKPVKLVN